jgi:hypothetical protein
MAIKVGKSEKAANTGRKVTVDTELDDEDETPVKATITPATEGVDEVEAAEAPAPIQPAQEVKAEPKAKLKQADNVTIAMFKTVDPAPTVGHPSHGGYSFQQNGITKLEATKSYVVPRAVGEHLVDKKLAGFVSAAN